VSDFNDEYWVKLRFTVNDLLNQKLVEIDRHLEATDADVLALKITVDGNPNNRKECPGLVNQVERLVEKDVKNAGYKATAIVAVIGAFFTTVGVILAHVFLPAATVREAVEKVKP